ncbi:mitochondrial amidoxime-reducing component 1 [Procambarus clarkii]|uniref:mitochondrial amidoxime-reducing component 1 n=1 Tax=Procambarus clarkii TaxID=6728 RepID=UPI0037420894
MAMGSTRTIITTAVITAGIALLALLYQTVFKRHPQISMRPRKNRNEVKDMKWECAGRVVKIMIYPVKSCSGIVVGSAKTKLVGLVDGETTDRSFIICNNKGTMITARMIPSIVLIRPVVEDNTLTLKFPGIEDLKVNISEVKENNKIMAVKVWSEETSGLDCGDGPSNWLQMILGRKCHLLYHADLPSPRMRDVNDIKTFPLLRTDNHSLYADEAGFLLMTEESVADLQGRVQCQIAAENFRPNILVNKIREPYDEDGWEYVKIGEAVFRHVSPCMRCIFTTINHETGKKDPNQEPLKTLKTYRCIGGSKDPHFGIYLGLDLPGVISEGDEVFVTRAVKTTCS